MEKTCLKIFPAEVKELLGERWNKVTLLGVTVLRKTIEGMGKSNRCEKMELIGLGIITVREGLEQVKEEGRARSKLLFSRFVSHTPHQ